ncbi:MAG TPA: ribosomal protein S18-alanine N-acetyltransferase [Dehalococcoidia bacterium]|nr:ribosomal protein S18-alanine N-acetyltransferase [Dehalococcoidia bacterium]
MPAGKIRVRKMEKRDISATASLENRAFDESWSATVFKSEFERNRLAHYFVAETNGHGGRGRILGFAGLWAMVNQAHVVAVGVEPHERRRGLARLLVCRLLQYARELGMADATLECRRSNEPARRLYRQFGFCEVGERKRYYRDGEDAVIMTTEDPTSEGVVRRFQGQLELATADFPGALLPGGDPG